MSFGSVQSLSHVRLFETHESQHTRPPCPSPTPGVHSDSRPSSQWCHPAISSSVAPFSSCPQSLPASESFPMSQLFAWGGQIRELQIKTTMKYHFIPLEWLKSKTLTKPNTDKDGNQQEPHSLLMRMWNGTINLEHSLAVSYKTKHILTVLRSTHCAPRYLSQRSWKLTFTQQLS